VEAAAVELAGFVFEELSPESVPFPHAVSRAASETAARVVEIVYQVDIQHLLLGVES
jgi:hypothetical protein